MGDGTGASLREQSGFRSRARRPGVTRRSGHSRRRPDSPIGVRNTCAPVVAYLQTRCLFAVPSHDGVTCTRPFYPARGPGPVCVRAAGLTASLARGQPKALDPGPTKDDFLVIVMVHQPRDVVRLPASARRPLPCRHPSAPPSLLPLLLLLGVSFPVFSLAAPPSPALLPFPPLAPLSSCRVVTARTSASRGAPWRGSGAALQALPHEPPGLPCKQGSAACHGGGVAPSAPARPASRRSPRPP